MQKKTLVVLLVIAAMASLLLIGCSGAQSPQSTTPGSGTGTTGQGGGATVVESGLAFQPTTVDVAVGDVVTFSNEDSAPHNVKIDGQELGVQQPGESKTWTASKAGSFPFTCVIHPSMTGTVTVK